MESASSAESLPSPVERVETLPPIAPTPLSWRLAILAGVLVVGGIVSLAHESLGRHVRATAGLVCFIGVVTAFSTNIRAIRWRTIAWGIGLQLALALFIVGTTAGSELFAAMGRAAEKFLEFTNVGSEFIFGPLASKEAVGRAFPGHGVIFAFRVLPTILFVSAFFTLLYYFGILQLIVRVMARVMMYMMGTSGAETLSAVANVFMGQTEAPLIVKPYVPRMTRSELLAMMVGGMATISGGMMAVYIGMGADSTAILATSVMAAPCGLYLSKIMLPETETPETHGRAKIVSEKLHSNAIDAIAGGASDGLYLALNVAAMIIAFLAFITMIDFGLRLIHQDLSLTSIFSTVFYPVALLMGCELKDAPMLADLLGIKLVTNEMLAYTKLTSAGPEGYKGIISGEGHVLATYALTGFANLSSIGIQLGGIGSMAPTRRGDLAALGGRALLCGFIATLINASLAGMLLN